MASGLFTLKNQLVALIQNAWSGTSPSNAPKYLEYFVVAGGGGGGYIAGGGGAGGVLQGLLPIVLGSSYTVTVGTGGASATSGLNSVFGSITAIGGGAGGSYPSTVGASGGSGGGAPNGGSSGGQQSLFGQGTAGQGNAGGSSYSSSYYIGGGGGGAGTIGLSTIPSYAGNGGSGIASAISGSVATYAGGGGGAADTGGLAGSGGIGGGGAGGISRGATGGSGTVNGASGGTNTGGGGGGYGVGGTGGSGGSGIVIVRYRGNVQFFSGGTLNYDSVNNYTVHTFYASGTLAPLATPTTYGTTSSLTKSLRFRASNTAYLSRTPSSAGNQQIHTFSGWIKYSTIGSTDRQIISFGNGLTYQIVFGAGGTVLGVGSQQLGVSNPWYISTSQVFRDASAWYHIVVSVNTTQATSTDRVKVYVNGTQVTSFGTTNYPTQNYNTGANSTTSHSIGRREDAAQYIDAYMAEVNWIDGQALTPQSFGQYDSTTGVWQPMTYVGSYGTNGFYLPFTNTTSTTTLGYDSSGNSNNFATTGFSLTAGSTYDSMNDVPTLTSATNSNYCVMNPNQKGSTVNIANGNLGVSNSTSGGAGKILGTIGVTSGKWYVEVTMSGAGGMPGIAQFTANTSQFPGGDAQSWGYNNGGDKYYNGSNAAYGASFTTGDVIGIALNMDVGSVTFYKNNTSQGIAYSSGIAGNTITFAGRGDTTTTESWNFGQQPFVYAPPSGYVALNTYNLPTPAIVRGNQYMDSTTYVGILSAVGSNQPIMNSGSFQPDFVWIKNRTTSANHILVNSITYVSPSSNNYLVSNTTDAETSDQNVFRGFNSNGFNVGYYTVTGYIGNNYVGWQWKAGGTAVSNTAGSITSSVSANTTAGFSIVTYTGTGANATIGHGLSAVPSMLIIKCRNAAGDIWTVYHVSIGNTKYLRLNGDNPAGTYNEWQNTTPTSSVFYISTDTVLNTNGNTYVAYCFAPVAGFSAFGSYTGNGSATGPFVYLGFQPKYVMVKRTDSTGDWVICDATRSPYNTAQYALYADSTLSESGITITNFVNFLSNGFQVANTFSNWNTSSGTYIYMAFASNPFKYANAF